MTPGDFIAYLTAATLPSVDDLVIADLRLPGAVSRGTVRSLVPVFTAGALEFRDGSWYPATALRRPPITPPGAIGTVAVEVFALPGVVTIPRHVRARRVRRAIRADVAALFAPDGTRSRGWVTGTNGYRLTAVIAVEGARRPAIGDRPRGALAPAEAFDPASFLEFLAAAGVTWGTVIGGR